MGDAGFVLDLIDAVYLASIRGNRPRPIDRYIDYFGGAAVAGSVDGTAATPPASVGGCRRPTRGRAARRAVVHVLVSMMLTVGVVADVWAESPADQIRLQIDRVLRALADPNLRAVGREREREAAIRKIAEEIFDFEEMTRRALGQHWQARTASERAEITRLFSDLLERVYFTKIAAYNGEKVTVLKDSIDGDQATVRTRIVTPQGSEIPVDYRMLRRGDRWVAYDVSIEGVSLVANYRTQFNRVIRSSSYGALVDKLKSKGT